jgi:hypothetical protein
MYNSSSDNGENKKSGFTSSPFSLYTSSLPSTSTNLIRNNKLMSKREEKKRRIEKQTSLPDNVDNDLLTDDDPEEKSNEIYIPVINNEIKDDIPIINDSDLNWAIEDASNIEKDKNDLDMAIEMSKLDINSGNNGNNGNGKNKDEKFTIVLFNSLIGHGYMILGDKYISQEDNIADLCMDTEKDFMILSELRKKIIAYNTGNKYGISHTLYNNICFEASTCEYKVRKVCKSFDLDFEFIFNTISGAKYAFQ